MQFYEEFGNFGGAGVLIPVVRDGVPEGDQVPAGGDRLIYVDGADRGIAGRFQPAGDGHCAAHLAGVGAGTGYPGDDRRLEPVDRVGADAQQARALSVDSGGRAGLPENILGIVHPRADQKAPADMRLP